MKLGESNIINTLLAIEWVVLITVAFGGQFLTTIIRGAEDVSEHTLRFARAGHAHGGALTTLGMVFIFCLSRTDASPRTGVMVWLLWLVGSLGVSGGLFLHGYRGEPGQGSLGTTVIALGGGALMIAALTLAWLLFRSR